MERKSILGHYLHRDFHRQERVWAAHHPDLLHVSDIHPGQPHRRALTQTVGVIKVSFEGDSLGEDSARAAHQKDQNGKGNSRQYYRDANLQLRPFQLLLARQRSSQTAPPSSAERSRSQSQDFSDNSRRNRAFSVSNASCVASRAIAERVHTMSPRRPESR